MFYTCIQPENFSRNLIQQKKGQNKYLTYVYNGLAATLSNKLTLDRLSSIYKTFYTTRSFFKNG